LEGDQLRFTLREDADKEEVVMRFDGRINGDGIGGRVEVRGGPFSGNYTWAAKR
jgi:hypothetical protein